MRLKIYIDVLFFINFIMDIFLFWITAGLSKMKIKPLRLILGSFACALLYCLLLMLPSLQRLHNFIGSLLLLSVGLWITFRPKKFIQFLKLMVFAHIGSFALGGILMMLFYYTSIGGILGNIRSIRIGEFSLKLLLCSTAGLYVLFRLGRGWISSHIINQRKFLGIQLFFDGKEVYLTALIDTGNELKEPCSGAPVVLAEFSQIKDFFPEEIQLLFYEKKELTMEHMIALAGDAAITKRLRLIPFSSLGKKNGMLLGFQADKAEIYMAGRNNIPIERIMIGIVTDNLSASKEYNALVSPSLFQSI